MAADVENEGTRIFISYRRDDSGDVTGRIYDHLVGHFGPEQVVRDVDNIPLGVDFVEHIEGQLEGCRWFLAVIGDRWTSLTRDDTDLPRILEDNDTVRVELEVARRHNLLVVPVFVRGATPPKVAQLPESLEWLPRRAGIPIRRDPDFKGDIDKLITALERHTPRLASSAPAPPPAPAPNAISDADGGQPGESAVVERNLKFPVYAKKAKAERLALEDRLDEAMEIFSEILAEEPGEHETRAHLARLLRETSRFQEALQVCAEGRGRGPSAVVMAEEALSLLEEHRNDEALARARRALQVDPSCGDAWAALHDVVEIQGDEREMKRALTEGLAVAPNHLRLQVKDAVRDDRDPTDALRRTRALLGQVPRDRDLRLEYSGALMVAGLPEDALREAQRLVERNPLNHWALATLGLGYLLQGAQEEASQVIDQALERNPRSAFAVLGRGLLSLHRQNPEAAEEDLAEVERLAPGSAFYGVVVAEAFEGLGQTTEARRRFHRLLQLHPDSVSVLLGLAELEQDNSRLGEALKHADHALDVAPEHKGALERKARILAAQERWSEAEALIDGLPETQGTSLVRLRVLGGRDDTEFNDLESAYRLHLERYPGDEAARWFLLHVYKDRGSVTQMQAFFRPLDPPIARHAFLYCAYANAENWDAAREQLDGVLQISEHPGAWLFVFPMVLETVEHPEVAGYRETLISHALEMAPEEAWSHFAWASYLYDQGRYLEAQEAYVHAADLDPTNWRVWEGLFALAWMQDDYELAFRYVSQALEVEPEDPQGLLHRELATALFALGREDEYRAALGAVWERNCSVEAYDNLICSITGPNEQEERWALLERAMEAHPQSPDLLETRAILLERQEDMVGAIQTLEEAVSLAPSSLTIANRLAQALERAGRAGEAGAQYRRMCRIAPEDPQVMIFFGEFLVRQGRYEEALEFFEQLLEPCLENGSLVDAGVPFLESWLCNLPLQASGNPDLYPLAYGECARWRGIAAADAEGVHGVINAVENTLLWYQDRFAELSIPELEDAMARYPGDHRLPLARAEALWLGGAQRQALNTVEAICEGWPGYVDPEVTRIRFVAERGDVQYARHLLDQLASNPHVTPEYMNWVSGVVDHIESGGEYSPTTYHSAAPSPDPDDSGGEAALGGAVVGGTIGTFLGGPLGTVAGAAVGGFIGALFEDDEGEDDLSSLEDED